MAEFTHFLVRHGKAGEENLIPEGIEQSESARDVLIELGLGSSAILLCSDLPRAVQTATIIGEGLKLPVHPSKRLNIAGNEPEVVNDLDDFLNTTLEYLGLSRADDQPLIVVSHAPLLALAKGLTVYDTNKVKNGEVVRYLPGSWDGSEYRDYIEEMYSEELGANS